MPIKLNTLTSIRDSGAEKDLHYNCVKKKKEHSLPVPCDKNQIQKCKENRFISDVYPYCFSSPYKDFFFTLDSLQHLI